MENYTIEDVINIVLGVLNSGKTPAIPLSAGLILGGGFLRPGASARELAKKVILRQQEAGIPIGNLPSGAENLAEKMERIRMEVIVQHLLENVKISVVLPPGIPVAATGVSPSGPVAVVGVTTGIAIGTAVIS